MDRFKDKTVIVTGAGSGIGKSTAIRLDAEGAQLLIIDINEEHLDATRSLLKNEASTSHVLNIASPEETKNFFQNLKNNNKRLDALVNVAGILRFDNSHEVEIENWNKILEVNLTGTFFMCRYALPFLLERAGQDAAIAAEHEAADFMGAVFHLDFRVVHSADSPRVRVLVYFFGLL